VTVEVQVHADLAGPAERQEPEVIATRQAGHVRFASLAR
jgi:hypothetical protein